MTPVIEGAGTGRSTPRPARRYVVTDAQVHIWAADRPERPWPPGGHAWAHRPVPFGTDDLLAEMEHAGVDRAILVPPSFEGDRNDLALAAARAHPDRFAVMGRISVIDPDAPAQLERLASEPALLGVRLTFHRPNTCTLLTSGASDWLWPALERLGLSAMIFAPGQNAAIRAVAAAHPRLRIIVDALGLSLTLRDAEIDGPISDLMGLADVENLAVKATALPAFVTDSYPFPSLGPRLRRVLDAFGPRRVFWASDLTRVPRPYAEVVSFLADLGILSAQELEWVMGRGVVEWLQWLTTSGPSSMRD